MRDLILASCLVFGAAPAVAQTVEIGANIAGACLGSDGSVCGGGTHPLLGAHASWWVTDGVELSGRVGRVGRPSRQFAVSYPVEANVSISDDSRSFISALFVYHFRRELAVRPMLGIGSGVSSDAHRVACEPVACEAIPGRAPGGSYRRWQPDVIFTFGLSGVVRDRWSWRAGVLSHAFPYDENSTIETFAGVGYRFGGNTR